MIFRLRQCSSPTLERAFREARLGCITWSVGFPRLRSRGWIVLAVVFAALTFAGTPVTAAVVRPVLRIGADNAVRGSHFRAHELIRVVFTADARLSRRQVRLVRASAAGSFAALVPSLTGSCAILQIRASGSSGDVAAIALSRGLCPPPSASGTQGAGNQPPQAGSLPDPHGPPTISPASGTQGADNQPLQTASLPASQGPPTVSPASGTQGVVNQPPQTASLPAPQGPSTVSPASGTPAVSPASGTQGADNQPPQAGSLPDPHGPPTINPGPLGLG
jgi:hypothetical protein